MLQLKRERKGKLFDFALLHSKSCTENENESKFNRLQIQNRLKYLYQLFVGLLGHKCNDITASSF